MGAAVRGRRRPRGPVLLHDDDAVVVCSDMRMPSRECIAMRAQGHARGAARDGPLARLRLGRAAARRRRLVRLGNAFGVWRTNWGSVLPYGVSRARPQVLVWCGKCCHGGCCAPASCVPRRAPRAPAALAPRAWLPDVDMHSRIRAPVSQMDFPPSSQVPAFAFGLAASAATWRAGALIDRLVAPLWLRVRARSTRKWHACVDRARSISAPLCVT